MHDGSCAGQQAWETQRGDSKGFDVFWWLKVSWGFHLEQLTDSLEHLEEDKKDEYIFSF